jgi:hypothetical protein
LDSVRDQQVYAYIAQFAAGTPAGGSLPQQFSRRSSAARTNSEGLVGDAMSDKLRQFRLSFVLIHDEAKSYRAASIGLRGRRNPVFMVDMGLS